MNVVEPFQKLDLRKETPLCNELLINLSPDVAEGQRFGKDFDDESDVYKNAKSPDIKLTYGELKNQLSKNTSVEQTVKQIKLTLGITDNVYDDRIRLVLTRALAVGEKSYTDLISKMAMFATRLSFTTLYDKEEVKNVFTSTDLKFLKRKSNENVSEGDAESDDDELKQDNKNESALGLGDVNYGEAHKNVKERTIGKLKASDERNERKLASLMELNEDRKARAVRADEIDAELKVLQRVSSLFLSELIKLEKLEKNDTTALNDIATVQISLGKSLGICEDIIAILEKKNFSTKDFEGFKSIINGLKMVASNYAFNRLTPPPEFYEFVKSIRNVVFAAHTALVETSDDLSRIVRENSPFNSTNLPLTRYRRFLEDFEKGIKSNIQKNADEASASKLARKKLYENIKNGTLYGRDLFNVLMSNDDHTVESAIRSLLEVIKNSGRAKIIRKRYIEEATQPQNSGQPPTFTKDYILTRQLEAKLTKLLKTPTNLQITSEQQTAFENIATLYSNAENAFPDKLHSLIQNFVDVTLPGIEQSAEQHKSMRTETSSGANPNDPDYANSTRIGGGRRHTKKHVKKHRARTHKKKHNKKTHKRRANKKRRKTMKKRR